MDYQLEFERWMKLAEEDGMKEELQSMNSAEIEDAFYRDLAFGTGGLRGILGAGINRMNIYTVAKASQGLANYLKRHYDAPVVAVSFDSRRKSELFSRVASGVFAANGIIVWRYDDLMPTPCLSYAVRALNCSAGVMITASHNPAEYNGYKVYGSDGCQITTEAADEILSEIKKIDVFRNVERMNVDSAYICGTIKAIPAWVYDRYTAEVLGQSVRFGDEIDRNVAIVYSPLNGTGLKPVTRALRESGFSNITVVEEQKDPDGNFPTCPYPNPEIREAMELGLQYCERIGADLMLATDPDCDRCGIAVRDGNTYRLLTGNEVGLLLLDYVCAQRTRHHQMPEHPVFIKTIVTMDLAEKIAAYYGVETINVLTGFKFIGEVIGRMEKENRADDYICGFEESYGYLTGAYVRDKDAVNAAFLICEMFAVYKSRGIGLPEKLNELYNTFGFCLNTLHSYEFPGSSGSQRMERIMTSFHKKLSAIGDETVLKTEDYSLGLNGLPKSDVLKFCLENGSVVIRPSGTEPKLKVYISVTAKDRTSAAAIEKRVSEEMSRLILEE